MGEKTSTIIHPAVAVVAEMERLWADNKSVAFERARRIVENLIDHGMIPGVRHPGRMPEAAQHQPLNIDTIESLANALARAGEKALPIFGRKVLFKSVNWETGREVFTADMRVELQAVVELKP